MKKRFDQYGVIVIDPFRGKGIPTFENPTPADFHDLEMAAENSLLFCWLGGADVGLLRPDTSAHLAPYGLALKLIEEWGFEPRALHVWHKKERGVSYPEIAPIGVSTAEHFIIATRGTPELSRFGMPPYATSVHEWGVPVHSWQKPDAFYLMVERCANGPFASVYMPLTRAGWATFPEG